MTEQQQSTPLHMHTLESLSAELVSGRSIATGADDPMFRLTTDNARSMFRWYQTHPNCWSGNVKKDDVEALVDSLAERPPIFPPTIVASTAALRRGIYISNVLVHNFGGLHKFPSGAIAVDDFTQSLGPELLLFEGANGSGKTSLLSAICWALTGSVFRSQRAPEDVSENARVEVEDRTSGAKHDITPITPLPPASFLSGLGNSQVPLDTWVELTFAEQNGGELGKVRRTLSRSRRGKPEVHCSDMTFLGLDPMSVRVGTTMPGLIPYIRLEEGSELGQAIASITGIKPLENLAGHAARVREKLKSDFVKDRNADIAKIDESYLRIRKELVALCDEHPDIKPTVEIPAPARDGTVETKLDEITRHFQAVQTGAFADARTILGETFEPSDASARSDLKDCVSPALALIQSSALRAQASAQRLQALEQLSPDEMSAAESLITQLIEEAIELAKVSDNPRAARRIQLYARVANWVIAGNTTHYVQDCPVCRTSLDGNVDPETQQSVREHIQELLSSDKSFLEKTIGAWTIEATQRLSAGLCKTLQAETHSDLPRAPADLIRSTLVDELFQSDCLKKSLSSLRLTTAGLFDEHVLALPSYNGPLAPTLPALFAPHAEPLISTMTRVRRALTFAMWRKAHGDDIKKLFTLVVGKVIKDSPESEPEYISAASPLRERLMALERLVDNAAPIADALAKLSSMTNELTRRRQMEARVALYGQAALAIEELTQLSLLVDRQVKSLMRQLGARTQYWRTKLYQPAYTGAPVYVDSSVDTKGAIAMRAEAEGTRISAQHVSNSSELRATLLAFLIAFWEHLQQERGVLSTFLLDDLQELFDPHNRQRIANTIPELAKAGVQPLVTTNDQDFARKVLACAQSKAVPVIHRHVHPLSPNRATVALVPFEAEVDRKKKTFESTQNQNVDQPARDYIKDLRIYLENALLDLFDERIVQLSAHPTLSDVLNALRTVRARGHHAFAAKIFETLINDRALRQNSDFLALMNQSHHGDESLIMYNSVWVLREDCQRVRELVDAAFHEYQLWMRRDSRPALAHPPLAPTPMAAPTISVPIFAKLAAFAGNASVPDAAATGAVLDASYFVGKAVYYVKTENFGFSGSGTFRALVSVNEADVAPDNSLVIAINGDAIYARRLLRSRSNTTLVTLATEVEDPRRRPPSLFMQTDSTRLLPVVGIIFDGSANYQRSSDEAILEARSLLLDSAQVAFRVTGDSALPVALPDQIVLGGEQIDASNIARLEGSIVAIATTDGGAFLKRIGAALAGVPHVRRFESIGGRGESLVIKTEGIEDRLTSIPELVSCRLVLAILY